MPENKKIIIVGAGIGGITTALFLAKKGFEVTVYEKNSHPGGRCGQIIREGHRFDLGATIFFLPSVYQEVFKELNLDIDQCFDFKPIETLYRLYFDDDSTLDVTTHVEKMRTQVEQLETGAYQRMNRYVARGYKFLDIGLGNLLNRNFYHPFQFITLNNVVQVLRIKAHLKHAAYIRRYFKHPHLRMAFTFQNIYVGQSPYQASALFSMLPAAEMTEGSLFPKGGMHEIARKLIGIAESYGVRFELGKAVTNILIENKKAAGIYLEDKTLVRADIVVANADLPYVYRELLPDKNRAARINRRQFTCSAIMLHWALDKRYPQLSHHNVILAENYKEALDAIFKQHSLTPDPCFYIHAPLATDPSAAPEGEDTWSIVIPAPHDDPRNVTDWQAMRKMAREGVIRRLKKMGVDDIEQHIKFEICYMPETWEAKFHVNRGATFGSLSHKIMQMGYFRPHNRHSSYKNLYFTGGSTHPGNGIPLVLLSAKLTSERILHDLKL